MEEGLSGICHDVLPAGVSITLYNDAGFGGKNQTYTENTPTLGDMRSITSSLKTALVGK